MENKEDTSVIAGGPGSQSKAIPIVKLAVVATLIIVALVAIWRIVDTDSDGLSQESRALLEQFPDATANQHSVDEVARNKLYIDAFTAYESGSGESCAEILRSIQDKNITEFELLNRCEPNDANLQTFVAALVATNDPFSIYRAAAEQELKNPNAAKQLYLQVIDQVQNPEDEEEQFIVDSSRAKVAEL